MDLLKQIRHENVVAFIDEHQDEEHIVLVLEYVSGGELFDYIIDNGRMEEVCPTCICFVRRPISVVLDSFSRWPAFCL